MFEGVVWDVGWAAGGIGRLIRGRLEMMDGVGTGEGSGQALADADGGGRSAARRAMLGVGGEVAAVNGRGDKGDFGEPGFAARGAVEDGRRPVDFIRGRGGRRGYC